MFGFSCLGFILVCVSLLVPIRTSATVTSKPRTHRDDGYNYPQRRSTTVRSCDTEQMEIRLAKLENTVVEKSDILINELRESNQRLQELEMHISDVRTKIEVFRSELGNISTPDLSTRSRQEITQDNDTKELVEEIFKRMQVVLATLGNVNSDIDSVKKNISKITSSTSNPTLLKHTPRDPTTPSDSRKQNNISSRSIVARNCKEIHDAGTNVSGLHQIQPEYAEKPFLVFCDMDTLGGGWTYIQSRFDGYQDFSLDWNDYKLGFGNIGGEFWLGLEHIYQLTGNELNELLVELVDFDRQTAYAHYNAFGIGSEDEGYSLKILGGYSGDAGDSLMYHAGSRFSTRDRDQDRWVDGNCAKAHSGAWWYRSCDTSNLNGQYLEGDVPESLIYQGMYWGDFGGSRYSLAESRMMVRPRRKNEPHDFGGTRMDATYLMKIHK